MNMKPIEVLNNLPEESYGLVPNEIIRLAETGSTFIVIGYDLVGSRKVDVSVEDPTLDESGNVSTFRISLRMIMDKHGNLVPKVTGGSGGINVPGFRSGALSVSEMLKAGQLTEDDAKLLLKDYHAHWAGQTLEDKYRSGSSGPRMYIGLKDEDDSFIAVTLCERQNPKTGQVVVGLDGVAFSNVVVGVVGASNAAKSSVLNLNEIRNTATTTTVPQRKPSTRKKPSASLPF